MFEQVYQKLIMGGFADWKSPFNIFNKIHDCGFIEEHELDNVINKVQIRMDKVIQKWDYSPLDEYKI